MSAVNMQEVTMPIKVLTGGGGFGGEGGGTVSFTHLILKGQCQEIFDFFPRFIFHGNSSSAIFFGQLQKYLQLKATSFPKCALIAMTPT
jgi:hypothetical protein